MSVFNVFIYDIFNYALGEWDYIVHNRPALRQYLCFGWKDTRNFVRMNEYLLVESAAYAEYST
jgi:hypothetical protein